jgi:hypothetical protein
MLPQRQRSKLRGSIDANVSPGPKPSSPVCCQGLGERYQDDAMIEAGERQARSLVAAAASREES